MEYEQLGNAYSAISQSSPMHAHASHATSVHIPAVPDPSMRAVPDSLDFPVGMGDMMSGELGWEGVRRRRRSMDRQEKG